MCYLCVTYEHSQGPRMKKIKISKATVDRLPFAAKGEQIDYFDTELKGFGCRVSATAKTYFVLKRVNGRLIRVTLGRHGVETAEQARKDAIDTLSDLGKGIDVNREKARAREKGITLSEVLEILHRTARTETAHRHHLQRPLQALSLRLDGTAD